MKNRIINKWVSTFFAFTFIILLYNISFCQEGMGKGRVKGIVLNENEEPVPGVKITATHQKYSKTFTTTTDKKGEWFILGMASGLWRFTAEKEGYLPGYVDANISQLSKNPLLEIRIKTSEQGGIVADSESRQILATGTELYGQGNYDGAIAEFQSFLEKNPNAYQIYYNIGECYLKKENYDKAIEQYEKFLEKEPEEMSVNRRIAEAFVKKGDLENALPYFQKILEKNPEDAGPYYDIGEIYFGAGKVENAIEHYQKAHSLKPDWEKPIIKLAYAYMNFNRIEKAIEYFEKYLEVAPEGQDASIAKEFLKQLKQEPEDES
jgi:tetratricopeptide (TPR) repeat protein